MERTKNTTLRETTFNYLSGLSIPVTLTPAQIEAELLSEIHVAFDIENSNKEKSRHWRIPTELDYVTIARVILHCNYVRRLLWSGDEQDGNYDLVFYQDEGPNKGIYVKDPILIENLIRQYNEAISTRGVQEVVSILLGQTKCCSLTSDPDLIAVNNGIFNYKTKELLDFDPRYVFTSKSAINYNAAARNPFIYNDEDGTTWDVESWLDDLSDDEGVPELLWEVIGAIIRPNISWNKVVCFYSEQGNNGKGTLCALMRNLCGKSSQASIPFASFAHEFMLEPLTHISAVIVDENDVNDFTRVAASLKAVITGDYLTINRKFQKAITIQFRGLMVQCINDLPKFGDRSDSLYRRFLLIPFNKCFTGSERTYIKDDYLNRQDVLEYVLYKVLNMNYDVFSEPDVCVTLKEDYKIHNDPIRQYLDDVLHEFTWGLLPYQFLYDLYKAWHSKNNPSGLILGKQTFIKQIRQILKNDTTWLSPDGPIKTRQHMSLPEPLILRYELKDWMNKDYKGNDQSMICQPTNLSSSYRGLIRS